MKEWANTLLLCTVFSSALKSLLPRGEKSPMYSSLKFLLSLILILAVFSPLFSFFSGDGAWKKTDFSLPETVADEGAMKEELFQKARQGVEEAVKSTYPDTEFELYFSVNEEKIPTGVSVLCEDETKRKEICLFIEKNFSLLATGTERKADET